MAGLHPGCSAGPGRLFFREHDAERESAGRVAFTGTGFPCPRFEFSRYRVNRLAG